MDGSSQRVPIYFNVTKSGKLSQENSVRILWRIGGAVQRRVLRLGRAAGTCAIAAHDFVRRPDRIALLAQIVAVQVQASWQVACPIAVSQLRRLFPSLSLAAGPDANEDVDPVRAIIAEFEALDRDQQDRVAKNLALLWDSFIGVFGGVSGFQTASRTEQEAYVAKLQAASLRMEAARGTDAAFHYVTVELIRQYISFLQIGSTDSRAVALAKLVAPLIDEGHKMAAEPLIYQLRQSSG